MKSCLILLLVALCSVANAQQQDDVIRVNTELVQTAVTVLDKKGNFVEGLQRDQFELMVDGKPRPVAFFERVASGSAGNANSQPLATQTSQRPQTPAATPRIPGRTIVFFVDDLHLSPDSMNRTRKMLQHFLDREMSSKDNVAILTASGQVGFLEQFTNNKAVLDTALGRLIPRPYDASGYSAGTARMTEFMAFTINTSKTDKKVLDAYVGECMKGANTFKKTEVLALIRAACETEVKNSARAILMQAAQITQNTYNSLESAMRSWDARRDANSLSLSQTGFSSTLDQTPAACATNSIMSSMRPNVRASLFTRFMPRVWLTVVTWIPAPRYRWMGRLHSLR